MLIFDANGSSFKYAVHLDNHVFDLIGIYVEAGNENHVFLAVLNPGVTAQVHAADVTGTQPSSGQHNFLRFFGSLPVTHHDLWPLDTDFADLAHGYLLSVVVDNHDFGRGQRQTDRSSELGVDRINDGTRRRFGQTVTLRNLAPRNVGPLLGNGGLYSHTAAHADAKSAEIKVLEARRIEQCREQRIDARKEIEVVVAHVLHECREVTRIRDQHVEAALRHYGKAVPLQGKDVIQRQRCNRRYRLDAGISAALPDIGLRNVIDHVAMAQHRAF